MPLLSIRGSTVGVDAQAADALARLLAAELHRPAVNARFDWNGGDLEILRPSSVGRDLDIELAARRLASALIAESRLVESPVHAVEHDYVLIQSSVHGDAVWFALYGRKPSWSVSVAPAVVSNQRPADPTPVREEDSHLPPGQTLQVSSARDGFDVQVVRVVTQREGDARSLRISTSYQPSCNVTLVGSG